jgi:drug/metabolite transporter (DMT)-like permease
MTERNKGILALLLLTLMWAVMTIIPRYLESSFTIYQQVYLRLFIAFVMSFIIFNNKIRINLLPKLKKKDISLLFIRSLSYYPLGVVLYTHAVLSTKISNVAFIDSVPMTSLLGFLILKEKFSIKKILPVIAAFMGVLIISLKGSLHITSLGLGELFALLSALFISLAMISRKWQSNKLNDAEISTFMLLIGSVLVFIVSLTSGEGLPLNIDSWGPQAILFLAAGGIVNVAISYCVNYGLSRVDAVLSGNIFNLSPVFTAILGFFVFKEVLQVNELIGSAIILGSAIVLHQVEINKQ